MELLFAHADDGRPVLTEPVDVSRAAGEVRPVTVTKPAHLADSAAAADDLVAQRWGLVVPAGPRGARLAELVRPLVVKRAADQGAPVLTIPVPVGLDPAAALAWKREVLPGYFGDDDRARPRYLMILGELDGVSLATQQVLAVDGFPGRLVCDDEQGYEAYVHKLLAWEREPSSHARARALLYTVHDGTEATTSGHDKLISPCHARLSARRDAEPGVFLADEVLAHGARGRPDPDELLDLVQADQPTLMFSLSHGLGPPRRRPWSRGEARAMQGAMHFGGAGTLTPADVAEGPFLPGGLWLYFACFGAGTPGESSYRHWLEVLARGGMASAGRLQALLSALPAQGGFSSGMGRAALANPDGPVAVIGHVDLAWSYSYEDPSPGASGRVRGVGRAQHFVNAMCHLLQRPRGAEPGDWQPGRVGAAMSKLRAPLGDVGEALNTRYDDCQRRGLGPEGGDAEARLALGHLWMLRQDLSAYVLLGDPAARLSLAPPQRPPAGTLAGLRSSTGDWSMSSRTQKSRAARARSSDDLVFNGVDGASGDYLTPSMSRSRVAALARGGRVGGDELAELASHARRFRQQGFGAIHGVDPEDLAQAGWAVVFAATRPGSEEAKAQAEIREALAPLLTHRRDQASRVEARRYQEYSGERGYERGETKQQFLAKLGAGPGPVNPDKVPYYLLLVASPEEIPYRIQYQLDVQYGVGRICFDSLDEYERYARGVVEAETGAATRGRRATFFAVANHDDRATQLSRAHLVAPLSEYVEGRLSRAGWSVEQVFDDDATHARLGALYRDPPALLFTASHGVGFPLGDSRQRDHQGALLCQDWGGPGGAGLQREHYFAGEDVDPDADLRGMIGVHFACYGLGTPRHDDFGRRGLRAGQAREIAPADMIARLPQRTLCNPGGAALAAIGHIDRAWGSSFLWIDAQGRRETQRHVDVFESVLGAILDGRRVGHALEYFGVRYAELAADLGARMDEVLGDGGHDEDELASMWVFHNDARNYAVMGDPAVRLKVAAGGEELEAQVSELGAPEISSGEGAPGTSNGARPEGEGQGRARPGATGTDAGEVLPYGWFSKDDGEPGMLARFGAKVTKTLADVVGDAATLEVKTYVSRDLAAHTDNAAGDEAHEAARHLRAYTRCDLDGDTEVYVPVDGNGKVDQALWTLHMEMVKQAQKHRRDLIKTVLSLLSPLP
ncbi:hypothetical protein [Haliangium sp.]|uniref:hypothetical protein n=1 Tax=Haliangium sp. TaxID=2663208 RepID=UPI003D10A725